MEAACHLVFKGLDLRTILGSHMGVGVESNWFLALLATFLSSLECSVF